MRSARHWLVFSLTIFGCGDADAPLRPGGAGHIQVESDPQGANIWVEGQDRHKVTPDTVRGLAGRTELSVFRDSAGGRYGFMINLDVQPDSVVRVLGPLLLQRCGNTCGLIRSHGPNRIQFSRSPSGPLFYTDGTGDGLRWPAPANNSYASIGVPLFAGLVGGVDTVAIGIYDLSYYVGRPFPQVENLADFSLKQSYWLLPPLLQALTVRGVEVSETVVANQSVDDVVVIRLVFRNITNLPSYQAVDPLMPAGGLRFDQVYVGFALDGDVGLSDDDLFSYDPDRNTVFMYDAAFLENAFVSGASTRPGLVGLRILDAPAGARMVLNGWPSTVGASSGDWKAGFLSEPVGHSMMSGQLAHNPDHPSSTIGHMPGVQAADYRISVSAGPVTLAPGDSTFLTVAIALAEPAAGTFTSGSVISSGDPTALSRAIMLVAEPLRQRLLAAEALR